MSDQLYLTAEGAARLKTELAHLAGHERDELALRLRSAIQQGDLSENADYHKAKEDQGFLEGRIQEIEYILENAIIVEEHTGVRDIVDIGAKVTVQESGYPPEKYHLVGAKESDPRNGRITYESPIGSALMGKREGMIVSVETPEGRIELKILEIE